MLHNLQINKSLDSMITTYLVLGQDKYRQYPRHLNLAIKQDQTVQIFWTKVDKFQALKKRKTNYPS